MALLSKIKSWLTRARDDAALAARVDRLLAERLRDGRSEFARALRAEAAATAPSAIDARPR